MQALEGDILLKAMLDLIDQDIPSLPVHDAIYVQRRHKNQALKALEKAWMEVLGVSFKPAIKNHSEEWCSIHPKSKLEFVTNTHKKLIGT